MKFRATVVLLLATGCLSMGCQSTGTARQSENLSANGPGQQDVEPQVIEGPSVILVVKGLSCPLCAHNLDKQLVRIPSVEKAEIDLGTGHVRVSFRGDDRPTFKQLAVAVSAAGFTLDSIQQPRSTD